jgi:putative selenate reductase molybdopterin-binding subunit
MAVVMHGSGIANLDMGAATLKMNDDGSFNLLVGATDLGTGSDTILAQMAAEVLGVPLEDIIVYSSDTDFTPFDVGAYASSTTYISGGAVRKAAILVKEQIMQQAALLLRLPGTEGMKLENRNVIAADGRSVTLGEIGLSSLHQHNQHQIMATASHISPVSPPPTAAQFVEIMLDTESGKIEVKRLLMVVDCGRVINPITAAGQVEGGMSQAMGFALTEEMLFDVNGQPLNASFGEYRIPRAANMPAMDVIFVETDEPSGPFGAKSVAEIAIDGVAPAMASAIYNASGVWMREVPYTPERVKAVLRQAKESRESA